MELWEEYRGLDIYIKKMSVGDVYSETQFFARSRSNTDSIRLYTANRNNRKLLFTSFKEASTTTDVALSQDDLVWYAHRNGNIVKCVVSCIVHGSAKDFSDRDYQLISTTDGNVYNTTRERIGRVQSICKSQYNSI
jgi:hypothetical protein